MRLLYAMTLQPNFAGRRDRIAETLTVHLSSDCLDQAMSSYDEEFAAASTVSPSELIQCIAPFLPETLLTREGLKSLSEALNWLQDSSGAESLGHDATRDRTPVDPATQILHVAEPGVSETASPPRPHPHRPHSPREPRIPTLFMGTYERKGEDTLRPMVVEDLSTSGVGMLLFAPDDLHRGDLLQLQFTLDDDSQSLIQVSARVCWVKDDIFGAEFVDPIAVPRPLLDYIQSYQTHSTT